MVLIHQAGDSCPMGCTGRCSDGSTFPRLLAGQLDESGQLDVDAPLRCVVCGWSTEQAAAERRGYERGIREAAEKAGWWGGPRAGAIAESIMDLLDEGAR